jgi:hypothetical protein
MVGARQASSNEMDQAPARSRPINRSRRGIRNVPARPVKTHIPLRVSCSILVLGDLEGKAYPHGSDEGVVVPACRFDVGDESPVCGLAMASGL